MNENNVSNVTDLLLLDNQSLNLTEGNCTDNHYESENNYIRYEIPKHFPTFLSMINHWYNIVKDKDDNGNKEWRKHLSASEKKRFQRLSRVIKAFKKEMNNGVNVTDTEAKFEAFYALKKGL